eukprot:CAMPEP_0171222310 /NCGR_PEP_ID=MMETSP0790-20130122/35198_1 /TAXON_ID=2925 /ORGANISM="Alexandrium catenella, Strain OF101" /LENGTH=193 /DNA_ID=CAMNT_0011688253 /DNA_START=19 /DNA_END=598 /DNA_ORIENTATION=-
MADAGRKAGNWWGERAPVIHQLSIVGPERSKYCKATRQCIPLFDHYCAFLRNPVGQDNYAAFISTIVWSAVSCVCLAQAAAILFYGCLGGSIIWFAVGTALYFGFFACSWMMLLTYHLYLAYEGLTTWEMLQFSRKEPPAYLLDADGVYSNPYDTVSSGTSVQGFVPERPRLRRTVTDFASRKHSRAAAARCQ